MPPNKELCRNFQRGSCQYGDRCRFLHVTPQQSRPNVFGFGSQTSTQSTNLQQQKPNPFGFGVQNNSQARGINDFGSKQNQFKPFENKWNRFSPINNGGNPGTRQPDKQPPAPNHTCTDPESCKRQIIEDFEIEKPLWKLTCYGHCKNGPCDIAGDISYEELRALAYDDAKRGLNLQSIVERERNLLNSKLHEFETLLRNPYVVPQNSTPATQSTFPNPPLTAQSITPPSVPSFSQQGASPSFGFGMRPNAPNNAFGQPNSLQVSSQNLSTSGAFGSQFAIQSTGSSFPSSTTSSTKTAERNPFSIFANLPQIPHSSNPSPILPNGPNSTNNAVAESTSLAKLMDNMPKVSGGGDNSIWSKAEWSPGEIPEEAPPDEVIS